MDSTVLGIKVLGGDTSVRTNGQLIRLDQLRGTGPAGPQGEQGETGPQGASGAQGAQGAQGSLTLTVGLILVTYLVCNVPANLILLLDPGSVSAANQSSVLFNLTNHRAGLYTSLHLPCYLLAWLSSIVKAACYIACTANFRQSLREILRKWRGERV